MTRLQTIENAMNWQKEGAGRSVTITLGEPGNQDAFKIWAYDFSLQFGEFVQDGQPIDLDASAKKKRQEVFEQMKDEFTEK